eukprot:scaffold61554_cov13-Tisochrysis_lutea.AAC.1
MAIGMARWEEHNGKDMVSAGRVYEGSRAICSACCGLCHHGRVQTLNQIVWSHGSLGSPCSLLKQLPVIPVPEENQKAEAVSASCLAAYAAQLRRWSASRSPDGSHADEPS